jgi:hypothetical protein
MLKTKKNFALTAAALAVGYAGTAMAQVNLSDTTITPLVYSTEYSVSKVVSAGGVGAVSPSAVNLGTVRYARIDLANATFDDTAPAMDVSVNTGVDTLLLTGGASSSFAVFSLDTSGATSAVTSTDVLQFAAGVTLNVTQGTNVNATIGLYETQTQADAGGTDVLGSQASGSFITFSNAVTVTFSGGTAVTSSVAASFLNFATAGSTQMGSIGFGVNASVKDPTGTDITLGAILSAATATVEGDLTGIFNGGLTGIAGQIRLGSDVDGSATVSGSVHAMDVTSAAAAEFVFTPSTSSAIAETSFAATVAMGGMSSATIASASGTIGTIVRDGTNVDIPYITTFSDYNQRLIIVNRGSVDAAYTVTFTPESGVTATAGDAATGTVPSGETMVLSMSDVVTLEGKTRTAGHVSVVAVNSSIDVATTQVNLSDASTDTVVLQ